MTALDYFLTKVRCVLSSSISAVHSSIVSAESLRGIVSTVTSVASAIEQVIAASVPAGNFNASQAEQLTSLFGNLAGAAIQASHDALGQVVTPESVLALMPANAPLAEPKG